MMGLLTLTHLLVECSLLHISATTVYRLRPIYHVAPDPFEPYPRLPISRCLHVVQLHAMSKGIVISQVYSKIDYTRSALNIA